MCTTESDTTMRLLRYVASVTELPETDKDEVRTT